MTFTTALDTQWAWNKEKGLENFGNLVTGVGEDKLFHSLFDNDSLNSA